MIWAGALATWNYCNCEKINDDKVARFHTREKSSPGSQLENNKDEMDEGKKNVELIETLFHLEVVYLSVSALLVLCISWFAQRGLNLWCLLHISRYFCCICFMSWLVLIMSFWQVVECTIEIWLFIYLFLRLCTWESRRSLFYVSRDSHNGVKTLMLTTSQDF